MRNSDAGRQLVAEGMKNAGSDELLKDRNVTVRPREERQTWFAEHD